MIDRCLYSYLISISSPSFSHLICGFGLPLATQSSVTGVLAMIFCVKDSVKNVGAWNACGSPSDFIFRFVLLLTLYGIGKKYYALVVLLRHIIYTYNKEKLHTDVSIPMWYYIDKCLCHLVLIHQFQWHPMIAVPCVSHRLSAARHLSAIVYDSFYILVSALISIWCMPFGLGTNIVRWTCYLSLAILITWKESRKSKSN